MGLQQMYIHEKLAKERHQEMLHEAEQERLIAQIPHRSSIGRHAIVRLGAFLITMGMWLERAERHEVDLASARSLSGARH